MPNLFICMSIKFSNFENIEVERFHVLETEMKEEFRISRSNANVKIWDPIIMRYCIKCANNPFSIECTNEMVKIKSKTKSRNTTSIKLKIYISNQGIGPYLNLFPKNLSHRVKFVENDSIIWEIDSIYHGVEYSIKFSRRIESFRIESSSSMIGILASKFFIDNCNIQKYNSTETTEKPFNNIKYQSSIKGEYSFNI